MNKRFSNSKDSDVDFREGCQLIGTSDWLKPSRYQFDSNTSHRAKHRGNVKCSLKSYTYSHPDDVLWVSSIRATTIGYSFHYILIRV